MALIKTDCSDCRIDLTVDTSAGTVTARIPSNGKRGSLHVPAHTATSDLWDDGDLWMWDCPVCGHADSYDPHSA
ncbi:hypothetical protein GCM10027053_52170 [Intrasporangium mesophilum]